MNCPHVSKFSIMDSPFNLAAFIYFFPGSVWGKGAHFSHEYQSYGWFSDKTGFLRLLPKSIFKL